MLRIDPKTLARLQEIEADLILRRKHAEAEAEGRLGEIEGIDLTLTFLRDKRAEAHRIQQRETIHLGLPAVGSWNGS
ncbi:recombinase [Streptomyces sp. NPDC058755]|uniref:recombinase n=1 Tax=unclassified Streptomyces TaxID=2593676 RepID=UPI0036B2587B